jgi:16S rRNA (uracil1498-N3)-methyltransferase
LPDDNAVNARFYAPDVQASGDVAALPDDEAQHLTRVLRLKAGDAVRLFNGRGGEFDAVIASVGRKGVKVRAGEARVAAREARVSLTLAQAVLKGDRMDDVVRDAVMIGVAAIQPIVATRTEVTRAALERGKRKERWRRVAVSSAKQCGRAVVPAILETLSFEMLAQTIAAGRLPGPALMLVEPGASARRLALGDIDPAPPREATLVIGPEGGWTAEEVTAASGLCRLLTLGGRTIRADAMATVAIAALFARWGEF